VGEPPLLLPFSVFFAIRDAVSATGDHKVDPPLRAPATSEAILAAITAVQSASVDSNGPPQRKALHSAYHPHFAKVARCITVRV
jgi:hypothetical protein